VPALLIPNDWSVVVVGRWNRAILTPAGIGRRVFRVPPDTPLGVLIALDVIAPPLVKHDNMTVVADNDRLTIQTSVCAFEDLARACSLAANALRELPETPLTAVGFNVKYMASDYVEAIDAVLASDLDDRASDAGYRIRERQIHRSLEHNAGRINILAAVSDDGVRSVMLNFDLQSDSREQHLDWLSQNAVSISTEVHKVLEKLFQIPAGDIEYEAADRIADNS